MIQNWETVSIDWSNTFVQAKLKEPMFMHTPWGFYNKFGQDGCLKLYKSLYGSKFAPKNWYDLLMKALLSLGLKESPVDKCLLY